MRWLAALGLLVVCVTPVDAQAACNQTLQSRVDAAPTGALVDVPACTYHETVVLGRAVTLDGHGQATITGDNTRDRWFWVAASNVTIRNFKMLDAAAIDQQGGIGTQAGISNVWIDRNVMGPTLHGSPLGIGGTTNSRVTGNQLHHGGQAGMTTWRNTNLIISGNHVYGNNTAGTDPFWAAGGIKAAQDSGLVIDGNEVDHNAGPGIWIDVQATNVRITSNNVHDQTWTPIFYEISSSGEISGNTISASNQSALTYANSGCITLSSAADVNVHDNTCTDTLPLRAQLDDRADTPPGAGTGNVLQNNTLVRPTPNQATSWWQWSSSGPLVPGKNGNVDAGNVIRSSLSASAPTPVPQTITQRITLPPGATASLSCETPTLCTLVIRTP